MNFFIYELLLELPELLLVPSELLLDSLELLLDSELLLGIAELLLGTTELLPWLLGLLLLSCGPATSPQPINTRSPQKNKALVKDIAFIIENIVKLVLFCGIELFIEFHIHNIAHI